MASVTLRKFTAGRLNSLAINILLLLLHTSSTKGNKEEPSIIPSNQPIVKNLENSIKIDISSSIKDTRTVKENFSPLLSNEVNHIIVEATQLANTANDKILPKRKRHLDDNNITENENSTRDYLSLAKGPQRDDSYTNKFIQPTKTQTSETIKISSTTINVPGEYQGAPIRISEPQEMSFDLARGNVGRNFNQIQQSLGAIAKVTVGENERVAQSFRKSRDEENRKANPDIQDIITGIVKILHGKANGQGHHETIRPRPQPSRINNRGPPRISDLPPLEFDTPPAYVAPPLQQPNRIPPPYPFDIPPSPPSTIPLPPQPSKPISKLPAHPFIEGVPLPELLIPDKTPLPTEYDTISMSEPAENPLIFQKNNETAIKSEKHKGTSHKVVPANGGNKTGNKRVRPRPPIRLRPQNNSTKTTPPKPTTMPEIFVETSTEVALNTSILNETSKIAATTTSIERLDPTELPILLSPISAIGEATPVLESSQEAETTTKLVMKTPQLPQTATKFEARPGIVLDDPEYKPGGHKRPTLTQRPIITAPPAGLYGEVFDVTVHAIQGGNATPGKQVITPVGSNGGHDVSVITKPAVGQDFVSIDGKRTYINLFGETTQNIVPTTSSTAPIPTSYPTISPTTVNNPQILPPRKPYKKPVQPPVRIDTCIVGDDSTCDSAQNERCQTEEGVSSCHCRPGYNRKKHRDPCRRVVSMLTSLRVDRLHDKKIVWNDSLKDPESEEYQELSYEVNQAIASAMSMTPFSDDFINSQINSIYVNQNEETHRPAIFINMTIQLEENLDTVRPAVRHDIQKHLIRVIHRRNNNVGNSAIWVDSPPGSVMALEDVDECSSQELHDCHKRADCTNIFGSFKCACQSGLRDPWIGNVHREGRHCESCGAEFCNNRGECIFEHGQQVCHCTGSFYGTQCEVDGEVLGVAIGASVAAAIIIILTLVCLCMWSRRWSREQKCAVGVGIGSPVFGFMANGPTVKTPNVGSPPYQISLEERIRWAQMADVMAHANHYAQPEPGNDGSRSTYAMHGGYPSLANHTLNSLGSLPLPAIAPPVPLPRLTLAAKAHSVYGAHSQHGSVHHTLKTTLDTTSSSEEEDRADLLGRHFSAPRPKSRASVANQSGIYYDVDLERAEIYGKQNIPLNTYAVNTQHQMRPFFR